MAKASVLIVDDEKNILSTLSRALRVEDFDVDVAGNAKMGLEKAQQKAYDVLLLDVMLPDLDGIEVLRQLREQKNDVPVIVMSGHGTIETAVEATRLGAHDFIEKPVEHRAPAPVARPLPRFSAPAENENLRAQAPDRRPRQPAGREPAPCARCASASQARGERQRPGARSPVRTGPARSWSRARSTTHSKRAAGPVREAQLRGGARRS